MRPVVTCFLILCSTSFWAQSATQTSPQTPRQALMEMFFSKQPGTFLKHLPAITRATLEKSGALATVQQYSMLATQLPSQGKSFQTFETGRVMFSADDPKTGQKVEIVVENDSLQGDRDDIELSIHTYKNNEVQRTPFMPHLVFSMKIESGLWALNEISITIKLPLADPDLLKSIADGMKGRAAVASPQIHVQGAGLVPGQNSIMTMGSATMGSDANALADVRKFLPPRLFTRPPTPPSGTPALFLISMALALLSPTNTKLCSSVAGWRGAGIRDTRSRYQAAPTRRRPVFA